MNERLDKGRPLSNNELFSHTLLCLLLSPLILFSCKLILTIHFVEILMPIIDACLFFI